MASEERSFTYAELDAESDRFAQRIIGLGVGPESVVALMMERSADLLVAMLAVVKAGGAYAPSTRPTRTPATPRSSTNSTRRS